MTEAGNIWVLDKEHIPKEHTTCGPPKALDPLSLLPQARDIFPSTRALTLPPFAPLFPSSSLITLFFLPFFLLPLPMSLLHGELYLNTQ